MAVGLPKALGWEVMGSQVMTVDTFGKQDCRIMTKVCPDNTANRCKPAGDRKRRCSQPTSLADCEPSSKRSR